MKVPQKVREQIKAYEKAGFEALSIEPRKGSHYMVVFDCVGPAILTSNVGDPRAVKNNIAEFRRRKARNEEDRRNHAAGAAGATGAVQAH